jgi:uncharacterized protein
VDLTHRFTVPASLEDTWDTFRDIESVARCFPGATVTSVSQDEFKGSCKVKLGPISMLYTGTGTFVERDEQAHRFVVEAKGKDKRGNGTAGATITASFSSPAPDSTEVEVLTDLSITGKPAQFGRGVIEDVSDKLLRQFVTCLESKVAAADTPPVLVVPPTTGTHRADGPVDGSLGAPVEDSGTVPLDAPVEVDQRAAALVEGHAHPRDVAAHQHETGEVLDTSPPDTASAQPVEALDLGATVLPVLLRSYWKQATAGLLALLLLLGIGRRRGRVRPGAAGRRAARR